MSQVVQMAQRDEFRGMNRNFRQWADHVLGRPYRRYQREDSWEPSINVCEHEGYYCVVAELAGMSADQIDLRARKGMLTLSGSRALPAPPLRPAGEDEQDPRRLVGLHLMEIDYGPFRRDIPLPEDADVDGIEASYRSGLLYVRIPKK